MAGLSHVLTVDPTGALARTVRAAFELTGQVLVQIDLRSGEEALDEAQRTGCQLLITALRLPENDGAELAVAFKRGFPDAVVMVVGEADDPPALDVGVAATYLRRPFDGGHFMRLLKTGLGETSGHDGTYERVVDGVRPAVDAEMGPIPPLDRKVVERVVESLLIDVGAMAIVVANRAGDILLERGAVGYLDRELLTNALLPTVKSTIEMGQLVGGQPAALQFYDGDRYDVFVLSIGFHHFMCLVFDGQIGVRQFGAVNRFGRRAAEDLITLLGISAFALAPRTPPQAEAPALEHAAEDTPAEAVIERADAWVEAEPEPLPEPEPLRLAPVENLDLSLFDDKLLGELDAAAADDLFDPDKLAQIASETRRERGPLSYDEARELGIIP